MFRRKPKLHKTPEGKVVRILADFGIDLVLDVGANVGQTGEKLRTAGYTGKIISFEPVPAAHEQLSKTAASDPNWQVAPRTAVGAESGTVDINVSQSTDMSSILAPNGALLETLPKTRVTETVSTPIARLDALWEEYYSQGSRVFLKVDTQGFERQVLEGASGCLEKIVGVQLELSLLPLYEGEETYLTYLQDLHLWGFEPFMMWENYFSQKHGRQMQMDVVFMRPDGIKMTV